MEPLTPNIFPTAPTNQSLDRHRRENQEDKKFSELTRHAAKVDHFCINKDPRAENNFNPDLDLHELDHDHSSFGHFTHEGNALYAREIELNLLDDMYNNLMAVDGRERDEARLNVTHEVMGEYFNHDHSRGLANPNNMANNNTNERERQNDTTTDNLQNVQQNRRLPDALANRILSENPDNTDNNTNLQNNTSTTRTSTQTDREQQRLELIAARNYLKYQTQTFKQTKQYLYEPIIKRCRCIIDSIDFKEPKFYLNWLNALKIELYVLLDAFRKSDPDPKSFTESPIVNSYEHEENAENRDDNSSFRATFDKYVNTAIFEVCYNLLSEPDLTPHFYRRTRSNREDSDEPIHIATTWLGCLRDNMMELHNEAPEAYFGLKDTCTSNNHGQQVQQGETNTSDSSYENTPRSSKFFNQELLEYYKTNYPQYGFDYKNLFKERYTNAEFEETVLDLVYFMAFGDYSNSVLFIFAKNLEHGSDNQEIEGLLNLRFKNFYEYLVNKLLDDSTTSDYTDEKARCLAILQMFHGSDAIITEFKDSHTLMTQKCFSWIKKWDLNSKPQPSTILSDKPVSIIDSINSKASFRDTMKWHIGTFNFIPKLVGGGQK